MCSLETTCVHGENHGERERQTESGHVESKTLRVMWKRLDEHGATLCSPRFQPETTFAFCKVIQKCRTKNVRPEAIRSCAARSLIFGTSHNHETHGVRKKNKACEQDEANKRWQHWRRKLWDCTECGSEVVPATCFPAKTSCRILVRTKGFVTSYLDPNFVSSTNPRKPR